MSEVTTCVNLVCRVVRMLGRCFQNTNWPFTRQVKREAFFSAQVEFCLVSAKSKNTIVVVAKDETLQLHKKKNIRYTMLPLLRIWCKCFQELFNTDFSVLLGWVLKSRKLTTPGLREKVVGQKEDICDCVEDSYFHLFCVIRSIISNCHEIYKMLNRAQKDASHREN